MALVDAQHAVGPSRVTCQPGVPAGSHQDGVQVQGGSNVTFKGLVVLCPNSPGPLLRDHGVGREQREQHAGAEA
jgi:hypothetical protein